MHHGKRHEKNRSKAFWMKCGPLLKMYDWGIGNITLSLFMDVSRCIACVFCQGLQNVLSHGKALLSGALKLSAYLREEEGDTRKERNREERSA